MNDVGLIIQQFFFSFSRLTLKFLSGICDFCNKIFSLCRIKSGCFNYVCLCIFLHKSYGLQKIVCMMCSCLGKVTKDDTLFHFVFALGPSLCELYQKMQIDFNFTLSFEGESEVGGLLYYIPNTENTGRSNCFQKKASISDRKNIMN